MFEHLRGISTLFGVVLSGLTLIFIVYGQGKAKAREEEEFNRLKNRDIILNENIVVARKIAENNSLKLDTLVGVQTSCRQVMEGRVAKIEGKLNGGQK